MSPNETSRPKKASKLRWPIRIAIGTIILLVVAVLIAARIAKSYVDPDFIAAMIEAENNCRVQIAETKVSLFSFPAKIEIKDIRIGPRDEHADAGTKLKDRPPQVGAVAFSAESMTLEANLLDLLRKKISVNHLTLENVSIGELLIEEEGGPRLAKDGPKLDALFDPPTTVKGNPNPEYEEKKKRRDLAKERRALAKEQRVAKTPTSNSFTISELPLPATMDALNFNSANIYAKIRRNKTRITFSNLQVKVSDIDLDPKDLANHNRAKVTITGNLLIQDRDRTTNYADLQIRSEGDVIPFDPVTGYINPDLTYKITVLKGGKLDAIPSLVKLAGKIKKLNDIGLKLDVLAEKITLEDDTVVTVGYRENSLQFIEPTVINFNGHLLTINEGAWLNTGNNRHEAKAEVLLSKEASDKALGNAKEFLADKAKQFSFDQETVLKYSMKLLEPVTKDGQVWVPFTSTGDFNDPKVRPDVDLQDLAETMALEALGDILDKTQQEAGKQE